MVHTNKMVFLFSLLVGAAAVDVATSRRMEENDEEDAEATDERE